MKRKPKGTRNANLYNLKHMRLIDRTKNLEIPTPKIHEYRTMFNKRRARGDKKNQSKQVKYSSVNLKRKG